MAKRDKLTKRQQRQVAQTQQRRKNKDKQAVALGELSLPQTGLLISRYGEQADVLSLTDHKNYRCYLRQNLPSPVPGDRVQFRLDPQNQGIVESIAERQSLLERPSPHQGVKPVAANLDKIFVVVAPLPDFSATLLDRYLVAIENANIPAHIVANKCDLSDEFSQQSIAAQLETYQSLGYPLTFVSTKTNQGIQRLIEAAGDCNSILVGQSGVGKSSIINTLFPQQSAKVEEVSSNSRLGQHTTTASQLYRFSAIEKNLTGFIIDSPGIREFGLWHLELSAVVNGFIEFEPYIGGCRFRDCRHIDEPGCAILQAVEQEAIAKSRWQSYQKIIHSHLS